MIDTCPKCGHTASIPEPPLYSVVKDNEGDTWQRRPGGWYLAAEGSTYVSNGGAKWASLDDDFGPLTLIHYVPEESS